MRKDCEFVANQFIPEKMKKIQQKKYTPTEIDLVGYKILFWFKIVKNMKHGLPNNVKG